MANKGDNNLEYTLRFIEDVKNSDLIKKNIPHIPVAPRMDEPTIYTDGEQNNVLFSFCN